MKLNKRFISIKWQMKTAANLSGYILEGRHQSKFRHVYVKGSQPYRYAVVVAVATNR